MVVNRPLLARFLGVDRSAVTRSITRLCSPGVGLLVYVNRSEGGVRTAHAVVALGTPFNDILVRLAHGSSYSLKEEIKELGQRPDSASPNLGEVREECLRLYDVVSTGTRTRPPAPAYIKTVWLMLGGRDCRIGDLRRMVDAAAKGCQYMPKPVELMEYFRREGAGTRSRAKPTKGAITDAPPDVNGDAPSPEDVQRLHEFLQPKPQGGFQ